MTEVAARLDDRKVPLQLPVIISTTLCMILAVCFSVVVFFFLVVELCGKINELELASYYTL